MATIDIGKIKPVFKGTYDNSTAYVLDDIVYYNGSSYVAKTSTTGNLPTDTTKWNILASGSGGIWDSTLALGTAGKILQVNSGATALEFTDAPIGGAKSFHQIDRTTHLSSGTNGSWVQILNGITLTPAGTDSKMMLNFRSILGVPNNSPGVHIKFTRAISGGATTDLIGTMTKRDSANIQALWSSGEETFASANSYVGMPINVMYVDEPNTTSAVTYAVHFYNGNNNAITMGAVYSSGGNDEYPAVDTRMTVMEL